MEQGEEEKRKTKEILQETPALPNYLQNQETS